MAKTIIIIIIIILLLLIKSSLFISVDVYSMPEPNNATGFSIDLIHIDSVDSPYYDSSLSHTQTLVKGLRRSLDRFRWLNQSLSSGSTETDIERSIHSGIFLMRYQIGEQKTHSLGILDTGSNFMWTQCFPCEDCTKQSEPHYEPQLSSTHEMVLFNENECKLSDQTFRSHKGNLCLYSQSYSGGTSTTGQVSKDSFILASARGTTTLISGMVFGCSYKVKGFRFEGYLSGVIGLGPARDSLVSQLSYRAKGKFSYCMVSQYENTKRSTTRLNFGDNADVSGDGVVHIPLVNIPGRFRTYYVTLYALTIMGTKYVHIPSDGNLVVDSGMSLAKLPNYLYDKLKDNLVFILSRWPIIKDPVKVLDLCFAVDRKIWVPTVTLHFEGGNLELGGHNMFVRTTHNSLCLAALPAGDGPSFLGNLAQGDFLVGFDNEKKQVSFKPTDCTKIHS